MPVNMTYGAQQNLVLEEMFVIMGALVLNVGCGMSKLNFIALC